MSIENFQPIVPKSIFDQILSEGTFALILPKILMIRMYQKIKYFQILYNL